MQEFVVLVNEEDQNLGLMEKMEAHEKGLLHRAFSVLVMNSNGEMLLQKRALSKYHCGGLWTNACCSHPRENESLQDAATRRLQEELGAVYPVKKLYSFIYKAKLDHGLTEHELDHVFLAETDELPTQFNPDEVAEVKWMQLNELEQSMHQNPELYTPWFRIVFPKFKASL
ncbi:MAG: isopentenyl-diphosphate delta-isomerase [Luteibaculaceae bacterium]|jgi:isopentenyl-diphosphate delta-isomerase